MEIPKNNPDSINHAYMYIHASFRNLLENTLVFSLFKRKTDEIRIVDYPKHIIPNGYFKDFKKGKLLECPYDPDSDAPGTLLSKIGIPYLIDTVFTEEYSKYSALLTNPNLTEVAHWTSMDKVAIHKQVSLDPEFFNGLSTLRATHLTLNNSITLEETLNAYYSDRSSKP